MKRKMIVVAILAAAVMGVSVGCQSALPFDLDELEQMQQELEQAAQKELEQKESSASSAGFPSFSTSSDSDSSTTFSSSSSSASNSSRDSSSSSTSHSTASNGTSSRSSSKKPSSSSAATSSSAPKGTYVLSGSNSRYITDSELNALSDDELLLARNEIYARRGRKFQDANLQAYFNQKSWYHGTIAPEDFSDKVFNQYERANLQAILEEEDARGLSPSRSTDSLLK